MDKQSKPSLDGKDPHDLEARQLAHCSEMMEYLELVDISHPKLPFKERIAAMIMINTIRKDARKGKDDSDTAGTKVRKYTKSFADAAAGRSDYTGSSDDDDAAPARGAPS